jgi:Putative sterol carrier protein
MTAKKFIQGLPAQVKPEALAGVETTFHFDISGAEGGQYTISVADNKIESSEGLVGTPKCVVSGSDENFMGIVTGKLNPMMAILTGKVKISNQGEMLKYAKMFGLM